MLLRSLGRIAEMCVRARDFILSLAMTLRGDQERGTGITFVESWCFSAAMILVNEVEKVQRSKSLAAALGDLLVIARTQVRLFARV